MLNRMIKNLKEVIISPSTAFPRIAEENELRLAAVLQCLAGVILCLPDIGLWVLGIVAIVLLHWQFESTMLHLTAKLFRAKGSRRMMLIGIPYATAPVICLMPLAFIGLEDMIQPIGFVWTACLKILALKAAYSIGTGKAVGILAVFYVVLSAVIFALVFSGVFDGLAPSDI